MTADTIIAALCVCEGMTLMLVLCSGLIHFRPDAPEVTYISSSIKNAKYDVCLMIVER